MTTIAWDGKTLAADSQCGGNFTTQVQKIYRTKQGLVGGCGDLGHWLHLKDQIEEKGLVRLDMPNGAELELIVIAEDGQLWNYDTTGYPLKFDPPYAIGAGSQFAMGAMLAGKTAFQAIEIASQLDSGTGGEIQTATIDG